MMRRCSLQSLNKHTNNNSKSTTGFFTNRSSSSSKSRRLLQHSYFSSTQNNNKNNEENRMIIEKRIRKLFQDCRLPVRYLKELDLMNNFDPITYQRLHVNFDTQNGRPILQQQQQQQKETKVFKDDDEIKDLWIQKDTTATATATDTDPSSFSSSLSRMLNDEKEILIVKWKSGDETRYPMNWMHGLLQKYTEEEKESTTTTTRESPYYEYLDPQKHLYNNNNINNRNNKTSSPIKQILWFNLTESDLRTPHVLSLPFSSVIDNINGANHQALKILYQYGILLITDMPVPTTDTNNTKYEEEELKLKSAIAAFAASVSGGSVKQSAESSLLQSYKINNNNSNNNKYKTVLEDGTDGPMQTLYGNVWSTSSSSMAEGSSLADSAYGNDALPLHTDMTYLSQPPGLQLFCMVQPASGDKKKGESIFADGFAIADRLRIQNPKAFDLLSTLKREYHSIDTENGWYLKAMGEIIQLSSHHHHYHHHHPITSSSSIQYEMIRHNDLDRLPDLPPLHYHKQDNDNNSDSLFYQELYEAHEEWNALLGSDEFRLVVPLKAGDMMVVANQRCFHGRKGFSSKTPRKVSGCYVR